MTPPGVQVPGGETPVRNPGWAGNTGEFDLTEAEVRGNEYVGPIPLHGGHPGAAPARPFVLRDKDPDAVLFEGPYRERLEKILSRYPTSQAALIPALNMAHELRGHISDETMAIVGERLGLSHAYVRGVASFYTMYNKRPVGRFLIQVCTNISCNLCGGDEVLGTFLGEAGTELGETSGDGLFTVTEVECLAACGFPTAVQINSRYFENVTIEDVPRILERLRREVA